MERLARLSLYQFSPETKYNTLSALSYLPDTLHSYIHNILRLSTNDKATLL